MDKKVISNDILFAAVKDLVDEGRPVTIRPKGDSMLPFIRGGRDNVNLRKLGTVDVGDIVLAEIREGTYVLHRVFALDGDTVTLMGDGNLRGVERCRREDIAGTAMSVLRDGSKEVDCRGRKAMRRARAWRRLMPFRRIILGIYRRIFI